VSVVTQIQLRRGTAAEWTSANPTLAAGEFGYETDTGKAKIGNGVTAWNSLAYSITGAIGDITSVTAGTGLSGGGTSGDVTVSLSTPVSAANGGTGLSSLGTGVATWLGTPSSSNLAAAVTDETGSGALVFGTSPTLTDAKINLGIDPETASYTAVLANNSQVVTMNNASANTFSIPTDASVDFPVGTQITVLQIGAGQTTIQAVTAGTTTINSTGATANAPKLRVRYSSATCLKLSANNWVVLGDIS
jgi:hypothetical protein